MGQIRQIYKIHAPISKVWQALVDPRIIEKWGGGPAIMSNKEGFNFSLWGGEIHGTNTKIKPEATLEQDWYSEKNWTKPSKPYFYIERSKWRNRIRA